MDEAERVELSPQVVPLLNPVPVWRARLLVDSGEIGQVARWAEARGLAVDDEPTYPREGDYLVLARVLLATKQRDQVLLENLPVGVSRQEPIQDADADRNLEGCKPLSDPRAQLALARARSGHEMDRRSRFLAERRMRNADQRSARAIWSGFSGSQERAE